jgi:hypothetical protein
MKHYRGKDGRERFWLEPDEIESMMERELRKAQLLPPPNAPTVNIERFLERHLGVRLDQHATLDATVLGQTLFYPDGKCEVLINGELTATVDEADACPPGVLGRWRATMAHEASHVLMHKWLFVENEAQPSLLAPRATTQPRAVLHRCGGGEVGIGGRGGSDWREVQANMGMAALLMPRSLFLRVAREELARADLREAAVEIDDRALRPVIAGLAERFAVSRHATTIRLETLRLVAVKGQASLL